jgi:pimeloyl-ACP methyl ester carboxylesterase
VSGYIEVGGMSTWYDERGRGDAVALLHPGGVDARAWAPNLDAIAERFRVLTPEPPAFFARLYGELSPDGPDHFDVVAAKLDRLHTEEPALTAGELANVGCRTLVMLGDDDEVVLEHAIAMYRGLAQAELAIVPGTSHGLLVEKPALCNTIIVDFLSNEPVPTMAPIRRA